MFYVKYQSEKLRAVRREGKQAGPLVGIDIQIEAEFCSRTTDLLIPSEAHAELDALMRELFDGTLMIDNEDPLADDLVKLKRIQCAKPVLFEYGTTGLHLAFYVAHRVLNWLDDARWNTRDIDDPKRVKFNAVTLRINGQEFTYLFSEA